MDGGIYNIPIIKCGDSNKDEWKQQKQIFIVTVY